MKHKRKKLNTFEHISADIVVIVSQKFHENKITYYESIAVFEAAKHLFITMEEKIRLGNSEEKNEN